MVKTGNNCARFGGILAITFSGAAYVAAADDVPFDSSFFANPPPSALTLASQIARTAPGSDVYAGQTPGQAGSWAAAIATNAMRQYLMPSLGAGAPDWAKRIEFELDVRDGAKPRYSILTVQPIYQTPDKQDTWFVQASQLRYDLIDKYRDTTNIGLGYRRLLFDNSMLLGVNVFHDYEWTYEHRRYSIGGELKWAMLDFNGNWYRAITDYKTVDSSTSERALNGYDLELRSQVPYLPWMQIGARKYHWDSELSDDIKGWSYSATADISQNLSVEAGWTNDNYDNSQAFVKFVFQLARTDRPVMLSDQFRSAQFFEKRDMSNYTLDKVRRENKIIVERRGAGVIIARGN